MADNVSLSTPEGVADRLALLRNEYPFQCPHHIQVWAADEIERLRAELEDAKADIAMLIQKEVDAINGE